MSWRGSASRATAIGAMLACDAMDSGRMMIERHMPLPGGSAAMCVGCATRSANIILMWSRR
jgi:hypothetical protein